MKYAIGTYDETPNGKEFRAMVRAECDCDAQAESLARRIGEKSEKYDLTDMNGNPLLVLTIRRAGVEWVTRIGCAA